MSPLVPVPICSLSQGRCLIAVDVVQPWDGDSSAMSDLFHVARFKRVFRVVRVLSLLV
jgi:hypothetical protein